MLGFLEFTEEKTIEVTTKSGHKFTAPIKVTHKDWHIVKHPVSGKQYRVDHSGKVLEEEMIDENVDKAYADWQDSVKKKNPEHADKIKFKSNADQRHVISAEHGDRSFGTFNMKTGESEHLGEEVELDEANEYMWKIEGGKGKGKVFGDKSTTVDDHLSAMNYHSQEYQKAMKDKRDTDARHHGMKYHKHKDQIERLGDVGNYRKEEVKLGEQAIRFVNGADPRGHLFGVGAVRHDLSNIKTKKQELPRDRPIADIDPDWEKEQAEKRKKQGVKEEVELDETVEVSHDRYLRSHGKKASGRGLWAFTHKRQGDVDYHNDSEFHQATGSFDDAKKSAKIWAKKHGHGTAYVMEEVEQIDEISKSTMGSYVKRAAVELPAHQTNATLKHTGPIERAHGGKHPKTGESPVQWDDRKVRNRQQGIIRAVSKLAKEELEEAVESGNKGYGYHGQQHGKSEAEADKAYSKTHANVKKVAGAAGHLRDAKKPNVMVKHYLDSRHGRHLAGLERDQEYIKKDFGKFKKSYKESDYVNENVEQIDEISKETLKSYIPKAMGSKEAADFMRGVKMAQGSGGEEELRKKSEKRSAGIHAAIKKLAREELELAEGFELTEGIAVHGKYSIKTGPVVRGVKEGTPDHVKAHTSKLKAIGVAADAISKDENYGTTHRVVVKNNETGDTTHHHVYQSDRSGNKPIMSIRNVGEPRSNQEEHHNVLKDYLSGKKPATQSVKEENITEIFADSGSGHTGTSREDRRIAKLLKQKHMKKKQSHSQQKKDDENPATQSVKEEVELDEVSKDTLRGYVSKAAISMYDKGLQRGSSSWKKTDGKKLVKRLVGIQTAAKKLAKEDVELEEAIKLGSKVKMHAPGKDYHDQVGTIGEIRHGAYKGAPKTYTVDYGDRKSVQLDKKNIKFHKEDTELAERADLEKSHIEQSLAGRDINSKVEGKKVQVHKDNVAKAKSTLKKLGYHEHEVHSGLNEEDERMQAYLKAIADQSNLI